MRRSGSTRRRSPRRSRCATPTRAGSLGERAGAAPGHDPAPQRAGPRGRGGPRSSPRGAEVGHARRRPPRSSVAAQQHGLVVLDADRRGDPAGEALERHRVGARRRTGWSTSSTTARRRGRRPAARCPSPRSRSPSCRGCTAREPDAVRPHRPRDAPARLADVAAHGRLATDRGDASGTGYWSPATGEYRLDLLEIVDDDLDWAGPVAARRCAGPEAARPGPATTWPPRSASGLRPGDVAISLGTSGTVFAVSDTPTADATGAVAGFADATGRFLPLVCTLNATKVTDAIAHLLGVDLAGARRRWPSRPPPGAAGVVFAPLPRRRAHAEPARRDRDHLGAALGRRARAGGPRPRSRASCAACSTGSTRSRAAGVATDGGRLFLVGGGARSAAYRQVLADLAQRPVVVEHRGRAGRARRVRAGRGAGVGRSDLGRAGRLGARDGNDRRPDPGPGLGDRGPDVLRVGARRGLSRVRRPHLARRLARRGFPGPALAVPPQPAFERGEQRVVVLRDPLVDVAARARAVASTG